MKERVYQKPTTKVFQIQAMKIMAGSPQGGGGQVHARRFGSSWDDEEE